MLNTVHWKISKVRNQSLQSETQIPQITKEMGIWFLVSEQSFFLICIAAVIAHSSSAASKDVEVPTQMEQWYYSD